jgi:RNA ligase
MNALEQLREGIKKGLRGSKKHDWTSIGRIVVKEDPHGLLLFSYGASIQKDPLNRWTPVELISRGLVLDSADGKVVARPFDKFFNFGQYDKHYPTADIDYVLEKEDGSLGIIFFHPYKGAWEVISRGSFGSDVGKVGHQMYQNYRGIGLLGLGITPPFGGGWEDYTFCVEIIHRDYPIVVNYGGNDRLVLLGARHNPTGKDVPLSDLRKVAELTGIPMAKTYDFGSEEEILELLPTLNGSEHEGFVVVYKDGSRLKFKGSDYLRKHFLMSRVSLHRFFESLNDGSYDQFLIEAPDEAVDTIRFWKSDYESFVAKSRAKAEQFVSDNSLSCFSARDVFQYCLDVGLTSFERQNVLSLLSGKNVKFRTLRDEYMKGRKGYYKKAFLFLPEDMREGWCA